MNPREGSETLVVVLLVPVPGVVLAQSDVTVADLLERVNDLTSRDVVLESILVGSGSYSTDNGCRIEGYCPNLDAWNQQVQASWTPEVFR